MSVHLAPAAALTPLEMLVASAQAIPDGQPVELEMRLGRVGSHFHPGLTREQAERVEAELLALAEKKTPDPAPLDGTKGPMLFPPTYEERIDYFYEAEDDAGSGALRVSYPVPWPPGAKPLRITSATAHTAEPVPPSAYAATHAGSGSNASSSTPTDPFSVDGLRPAAAIQKIRHSFLDSVGLGLELDARVALALEVPTQSTAAERAAPVRRTRVRRVSFLTLGQQLRIDLSRIQEDGKNESELQYQLEVEVLPTLLHAPNASPARVAAALLQWFGRLAHKYLRAHSPACHANNTPTLFVTPLPKTDAKADAQAGAQAVAKTEAKAGAKAEANAGAKTEAKDDLVEYRVLPWMLVPCTRAPIVIGH